MKRCNKCGIEKELSEFPKRFNYCKKCFNKGRRDRRNGLDTIRTCDCGVQFVVTNATKYCSDKCRETAVKQRDKRYRGANPERIRANCRKYRAAHPEKVKGWSRKNYLIHLEERKAANKRYRERQDIKPKLKEAAKKWTAAHREHVNAKVRSYNQKIKTRDYYFKHTFCKHSKLLNPKEISQELLEAYKQYVLLKREVRNVRNKSI